MSLRIRLRRMGRKKAPHYRIVVAESSSPRDGRFVATLGHYNPRTVPTTLVVDHGQARDWLARGATPTDTVQSLLKQAGVYKEPSALEAAAASVGGVASRAADAVQGVVGRAASAVAGAAGAVAEVARDAAETVAEAAGDARDAVAERLGGGDEEAKPAE